MLSTDQLDSLHEELYCLTFTSMKTKSISSK